MVLDTSALVAVLLAKPQAGLNFGDCFSYALARVTSQPLPFVGGDFSQTDIAPACA